MNIALICTEKLPVPPIAGGAIQLYIEGILPYISPFHNFTVFGIQHPNLPNEETKNGVKYIRVPAATKSEYLQNIKLHLNDSFDLVHVLNRPTWVNELSEKLPNVKFSLSLHNEMFLLEKISPSKAKECIDRVEFINTVSKFIADGVSKAYPMAESKLRVVYSGMDINKLKPNWSDEGISNREMLKLRHSIKNYRVVLFIGRLSEKKGAHILLKAMKDIMDVYKDVALVVVGSKWYGENKEDEYTRQLQFITKKLKGPVIFTGFLPPEEAFSYYNMGDIFVCPSQWNEPLARVHYEAMAAGLPIITTNRGGNAEVVADLGNGIVIDDFTNYKVFAEKIKYLLNNPDIALEYGKTGRQLAEERFNWERVAKEVFKTMFSIESIEEQVKNEISPIVETFEDKPIENESVEDIEENTQNIDVIEHIEEEKFFEEDF